MNADDQAERCIQEAVIFWTFCVQDGNPQEYCTMVALKGFVWCMLRGGGGN